MPQPTQAGHDKDVQTDAAVVSAIETMVQKLDLAIAAANTYVGALEVKDEANKKLQEKLNTLKKSIDVNGDGKISPEELQKALETNPALLIEILTLQNQIKAATQRTTPAYQAYMQSLDHLGAAIIGAVQAVAESAAATTDQKTAAQRAKDALEKLRGGQTTASAGSGQNFSGTASRQAANNNSGTTQRSFLKALAL
jgi:hypothetical protein